MFRKPILFAGLVVLAWLVTVPAAHAQVQRVEAGYNPYTGTSAAAKQTYNPYTGTETKSTASYNPYTGRDSSTKAAYNPMTGTAGVEHTSTNPMTGATSTRAAVRRR